MAETLSPEELAALLAHTDASFSDLGHGTLPAVLDTSCVRTGLHHQLSKGYPPASVTTARDGSVRLFMEYDTLVETQRKLTKFARDLGVTPICGWWRPSAAIAKVAFTSEDRVRDVIGNFNADGFSSLYPKYKGGRPPKFTLGQRREIKKIAKSRPTDHDLPFSTWSLTKLADFLVAEAVVDDISHEGLRALLREEGVTFQRLKTWKTSTDPNYQAKKARIEHLYAIADRTVKPGAGDPAVVFCVDEFGPLNLQPRPGRQWAPISGKGKEPGRAPRRRPRATYTRTKGVRHLFAAYDLTEDKLFGHIKPRKTRARFLEFCRYLRSLYPPDVKIAIICDNFSPHLTTRKDKRVGQWAAANNAEIAYTPTNASWSNRIEAQFTALRYFALDGTDHATHQEQASMIRRYIIWRNNHAYDERLRRIVTWANVA